MTTFNIVVKVSAYSRTKLRGKVADLREWLRSQGVYVEPLQLETADTEGEGVDTSTAILRGAELADEALATELFAKLTTAVEEAVGDGAKAWQANLVALGAKRRVFDERDDLRARPDGSPPEKPLTKQRDEAIEEARLARVSSAGERRKLKSIRDLVASAKTAEEKLAAIVSLVEADVRA